MIIASADGLKTFYRRELLTSNQWKLVDFTLANISSTSENQSKEVDTPNHTVSFTLPSAESLIGHKENFDEKPLEPLQITAADSKSIETDMAKINALKEITDKLEQSCKLAIMGFYV